MQKLFKLLLGNSWLVLSSLSLFKFRGAYFSLKRWFDVVDVVMLRVQQELQEPKSRFFQKFSIGKAAVAQEAQASKPLLPGGYTSQCFVFCDGRKKLLFGGIRMLSMFSRRGNRFHSRNLCFQKAKTLGNFLLQYVSIIFCQTCVLLSHLIVCPQSQGWHSDATNQKKVHGAYHDRIILGG